MRCVQQSTDTAAPVLSALRLAPKLGRAGTRFRASFVVDQADEVDVSAVFRDGTSVQFARVNEEYHFTSDGGQPEGDIRLRVLAMNRAGNVAEAQSRVVGRLDFTAPSLVSVSTTFESATAVVPQPDALGTGGLATVVARFDEPLVGQRPVAVSPAGVASVAEMENVDLNRATWQARVRADAGVGTLILTTVVEDEAGNQRRLSLEPIPYDTEAPRFNADGGIRLEQTQLGIGSQFRPIGNAPGAGLVRALVNDGGVELGRVTVTDGGFALVLLAASLANTTVEAFDSAGNRSDPTRPTRLEWLPSSAILEATALGAVGPRSIRGDGIQLQQPPWESRGQASWEAFSYFAEFGAADQVVFALEEGRSYFRIGRQLYEPRGQGFFQAFAVNAEGPMALDSVTGSLWFIGAFQQGLSRLRSGVVLPVASRNQPSPLPTFGSMAVINDHLVLSGEPGKLLELDQGRWTNRVGVPTEGVSLTADPRRRQFLMSGSFDGGAYELWKGELDGGWQRLRPLSGPHVLAYVASRDVLWGVAVSSRTVFEQSSDGGIRTWPGTASSSLGNCTAREDLGLVECSQFDNVNPVVRFVDGGFQSVVRTSAVLLPSFGWSSTVQVLGAKRGRFAAGGGGAWVSGGGAYQPWQEPKRLAKWDFGRFVDVNIEGPARAEHFFAGDQNSNEFWMSGGVEVVNAEPFDAGEGTWRSRDGGPWQRVGPAAPLNRDYFGIVVDGGVFAIAPTRAWYFGDGGWRTVAQVGATNLQHVVGARNERVYALDTNRALWSAPIQLTTLSWARVTGAPNVAEAPCWTGFDDERGSVLMGACSPIVPPIELYLDGGGGSLSVSDPEGDGDPSGDSSQGVCTDTVYDLASSRLLCMSEEPTGWALKRAENRPAVRIEVPSFAPVLTDAFSPFRLDLRVSARGDGVSTSRPRVPVAGYEVVFFVDGAFRSVARVPANGVVSIGLDGLTLSRLAPGPSLLFEVRALGVNGVGEARLGVDDFEVKVTRPL